MEIDFACRRVSIEEVVTCAFGLGKGEYAVLRVMLNNGSLTVPELAGKAGKDRSTVQRAIKSLVEKKLVVRHQENLSGGGYVFHYKVRGKHEMKERILENFKGWQSKVLAEIERW
ncbi:MAG: helix-turn-helix domain-containing protein [Candidatus Woesearchaeota archaeon]